MKKTTSLLNPKAKLFEELKIQQPKWWNLLREDEELYIEIRKDNSINVYFFGGSIARINYKNDFEARIHQKYYRDVTPQDKTKKRKDLKYVQINLAEFDKKELGEIKNLIKTNYIKYSDENKSEKISEKYIQGKMILENPNYIDSEFQFDKNKQIGKLRIDLIELKDGILSLLELKGIFDNRLRNDVFKNPNAPEIIKQIEKYRKFINEYKVEIIEYYKKLIEIKQSLGLTKIENTNFTINEDPKLIIANTYIKPLSKQREKRIEDIKNTLDNYKISYKIIP